MLRRGFLPMNFVFTLHAGSFVLLDSVGCFGIMVGNLLSLQAIEIPIYMRMVLSLTRLSGVASVVFCHFSRPTKTWHAMPWYATEKVTWTAYMLGQAGGQDSDGCSIPIVVAPFAAKTAPTASIVGLPSASTLAYQSAQPVMHCSWSSSTCPTRVNHLLQELWVATQGISSSISSYQSCIEVAAW